MSYMKGCSLLDTLLFTLKFDCLLILKHGGRLIRIGSLFKSGNSFSVKSKVLRRGQLLHIQKPAKINPQFFFYFSCTVNITQICIG